MLTRLARADPAVRYGLSELTQAVHEIFDSRGSTVTSQQHSVQVWAALRGQHGKTSVRQCSGLQVVRIMLVYSKT